MRYRPTRPSAVLAIVAAVVVASPIAVLYNENAPDSAVESSTPAVSDATVREVALDTAPSVVLDLVRSGLARAGVTLPPLDVRGVPLPDPNTLGDFSRLLPSGIVPSGVIPPSPSPAASPASPSTTPTRPDGVVVKEITRPDPFSMIALTWADLQAAGAQAGEAATAFVRAKQAGGGWGPWLFADPVDGGPVRQAARGTEPVWVGATRAVQVAVTRAGVGTPATTGSTVPPAVGSNTPAPGPATMSVTPGQIQPRVFTAPRAPAGPANGSQTAGPVVPTGSPAASPQTTAAPVNTSPSAATAVPTTGAIPTATSPTATTQNPVQTALSTLRAALIDPGSVGNLGGGRGGRVAPGQQPPIITRAQWGADESKKCGQPTYDPKLDGAVVHHTAGSNDYTPQQSAEIVRGIYAYHAQTLGWCDIGYNALVDKYGQVFEGAAGGLDKNVQGTHTGGFNKDTVGVAMIGDYNTAVPTPDLLRSVGSFLGWRLKLAGLDPKGNARLTSQGFDGAKFAAGQTSDLPMISGHRDYGSTECPGNLGYAALPIIREVAAGNVAAADSAQAGAAPSASTSATPAPAVPSPTAPGGTTTTGTTTPGSESVVSQLLSTGDTGAIAQKWKSLGGPAGELGAARTGERTTPNGAAKFADFTNGQIYWSPQTGAQVVQGLIGKSWAAAGYENSALGLPAGGEDSLIDGIVTQAFQWGSLVFNKSTGAVVQVAKAFIDEFIRSMKSQLAPGASVPVTTMPPVG